MDFEDADSLQKAIELDGTVRANETGLSDLRIYIQCINDRPIRIDVAARTLGANKPEGFRNKRKDTSILSNNNESNFIF